MISMSRHLVLTAVCGVLVSLAACSSGSDGVVVENVGAGSPPPAMDTAAVLDAAATSPKNEDAFPASSTNLTVDQRLARLEADVAGVKSQMVLVRPILEKMPALQDKLGELVDELQRIDARVAAAQAHVETLPPTTAVVEPMPAPFKPAKMTPIVEPAPVKVTAKPAPVKTIEPLKKPVEVASSLAKAEPAPVAPVAAAKGEETKPAPVVAAPTADVSVPTLQHIRVGDDAGKTRLVLDMNKKVPYTYDLDNTEKILIIDVDAHAVSAVKSATFDKSPLISSYAAEVGSDGKARVVLQLRRAVKVMATSTLPPNGDKGDRVVIDLGAM